MKTPSFAIALSAAIAATLVCAPAQAETKLRGVGIVSNQNALGALPRLVVKRSGGKLVLEDRQINIPVRVGGRINNSSNRYVIAFADVRSGSGDRMSVLPRQSSVRSIDATLVLPFRKRHYGAIGAAALAACEGHSGTQQKVIGISGKVILEVGAYKTSRTPIEVGSPFHSWPEAVNRSASVQIPAEVVCPAAETPVRVSSVSLKVERKNMSCPTKVILSATIRTNKPGNTELVLRRNDGATDTFPVVARKVGSHFIAHFKRGYSFDRDTFRRYRIETVAGTPWTDWVDMKVSCGGLGLSN